SHFEGVSRTETLSSSPRNRHSPHQPGSDSIRVYLSWRNLGSPRQVHGHILETPVTSSIPPTIEQTGDLPANLTLGSGSVLGHSLHLLNDLFDGLGSFIRRVAVDDEQAFDRRPQFRAPVFAHGPVGAHGALHDGDQLSGNLREHAWALFLDCGL